MCGICGIVDWESGRPIDRAVLERMVWLLRHRGPDEFGLYLDDQAGLGHARLSIIDLTGGAQPMSNEDGSLWIVFNGEIYNYVELTPELKQRGHRFSTRSDTEVILHLYEEYGAQCVDHMNGQFAFAIWDTVNRRVFMARDRLGIRPLYYTTVDGRLAFASEMKALFAAPGINARLDPIGLDQVFTFWSAVAPRTTFEGIGQVPPGHCLTATSEGIQTHRYWNLDFPARHGAGDEQPEAYYIDRLREELVQATRLRMRADVPVGAYLSGGLDSSLTSAIVKSFTDTPLDTFSIEFQDAAFDETEHQQTMVGRLGTDHHSVSVGRPDIAAAFPEVVWHAETPLLRTASVPLHHLSKLVRENDIKVVVSGEGADEVLAGYNIFKESKIRRFWARQPESAVRPMLLSRLYPYIQHAGAGAYWQRFFAQGLTDTDNPCYSHMVRWNNTSSLKRFFSRQMRDLVGGHDNVAEFEATLDGRFRQWDPLSQAQYIEITTFLAGYLLSSQGDRVAMSHSVEGRVPFLDHNVVEFCTRIPPRHKLRGLEEKHILRHVARELVPASVRQRAKQPYRAPDSACFFAGKYQQFVRELLAEEKIRAYGYFEPKMVARLVDKCRRKHDETVSVRDDMALVGILSTQILHKQFIEESPGSVDVPDARFHVRGLPARTGAG